MSITSALCNSYKKEILEGVHDSTDTYKIALFDSNSNLSASTTVYSTSGESDGAGYTAGGIELSGFTTGLSGSTAYLTFSDPSWPNSTITARGCMIYNSSKSNKAVAVFNFGQNVSSVNGTFTVDFPGAGGSSLIRIA
jgi:hypothetical protein